MFFCGIDLGTTNTKAVLLSGEGEVLDSAQLVNHTEKNNSPAWIDCFLQILDKIKMPESNEKIVCSFATQGGSFIFLDKTYRPLSEVCSWTELADKYETEKLREDFGTNSFYNHTGWPPDEWLACCKIRQMMKNKSPNDRPEYIAFVPEFIHSQLCKKLVTDATNAQITGLFNFSSKSWNSQFCKWAKIETTQLAKVSIKPEIIAEGLVIENKNITLATSIHDQYAAMAAVDLKADKEVMLATGTAWVLSARTKEPLFNHVENTMHPGYDIITGDYGNIMTLGPVGKIFEKLLDQMTIPIERISELENKINLNNIPEEKLFYDIWSQPSPFNDIPNFTLRLQRYMEWAASVVAFHMEKLSETHQITKIYFTGGAANSNIWPQLIAEICNLEVEAFEFDQLTAFGAAITAHKAVYENEKSFPLPDNIKKQYYKPQNTAYREWYIDYQRKPFSNK
jgi:gluconokinase